MRVYFGTLDLIIQHFWDLACEVTEIKGILSGSRFCIFKSCRSLPGLQTQWDFIGSSLIPTLQAPHAWKVLRSPLSRWDLIARTVLEQGLRLLKLNYSSEHVLAHYEV